MQVKGSSAEGELLKPGRPLGRAFANALERFSESERTALLLSLLEGRSEAEIADELGYSRAQITLLLKRASARLRVELANAQLDESAHLAEQAARIAGESDESPSPKLEEELREAIRQAAGEATPGVGRHAALIGESAADTPRRLDLLSALDALERAQGARRRGSGQGASVMDASERIRRLDIPAEALLAFAEAIHELLPADAALDVSTARRAALVAASERVWDDELGTLLDGAHVREMLGGVSRQRVSELTRNDRLIALETSGRRRLYPAFQFTDGKNQSPLLVDAFHRVASNAASKWTAAAWCVGPDPELEGLSPLEWVRAERDPDRLLEVADHDSARLAR